ncbi:DMT family transporter [Ectobacillus sp. JY-23]|uniref:DMT family transporter n=1 Tax=Ectobacillus sp. JY-23 TaxID=2933872 RepID=UPI001FF0EFE4|nr:DMT family transporter [Ectobacillus sp. JY-23]UOY93792.1 DMT family transporter [Ectobacillus sp. JY-23]
MGKLYGALLTLSVIWGASFLFIKILVADLGPWGVVFWRCLFGAITLLCVLAAKREAVAWKDLPFGMIVLVGFVNNVLPFGFIAIGETKVSSGMASIINAMTPISTVIVGYVCFKLHVRRAQWMGILLGFFGILLVMRFDVKQFVNGDMNGVLLVLLATLCYAVGTQLSKRFLQHLSVLVMSATTLLSACVISFFSMVLVSDEGFRMVSSSQTFVSLVGLGTFGSGFAYLLFYYMVKEGSAEFASFVTYIVPLSALLWGSLLLGEDITYHMLIGLTLIFGGIYLSTFQKKQSTTGKDYGYEQ